MTVSSIVDEAHAIKTGGGHSSIIGRNSFQRSKADALALLEKLVEVYRG